jgi:hypothetical protein
MAYGTSQLWLNVIKIERQKSPTQLQRQDGKIFWDTEEIVL